MRVVVATVFVLTTATVAATVGCRADYAPAPSAAGSAVASPTLWAKPTVRVVRVGTAPDLVVRLFEIRHAALGKSATKIERRSVLAEPADTRPNVVRSIYLRRCRPDDPFLAKLESWRGSTTRTAALVKTIRLSADAPQTEFAWDAAGGERPSNIGGISMSVMRLDDGRVRLEVGEDSHANIINGSGVPGLVSGWTDSIEPDPDEVLVFGGMTVMQPAAQPEKRRLLGPAVDEEKLELLATVTMESNP